MNGIFNILTFLVFFLITLGITVRTVLQIHKFELKNSFYMILGLGLLGLLTSEAMRSFGGSYFYTIKIMKSSLLLICFDYLALTLIGILKTIDAKKLKTLLRVPIIGMLLGWYLQPQFFLITFILVELITSIILFSLKKTQVYSYRQHLKSLFGVLLILFMYYNYVSFYYIGLIIYLLMKTQIANGVKLKLQLYSYELKQSKV